MDVLLKLSKKVRFPFLKIIFSKHVAKQRGIDLKKLFFSLFIFGIPFCQTYASMGLTNMPTGGLFGDNTIQYLKSKWLAHKYNLEFYFSPFINSDQLVASEQENLHSMEVIKKFDRQILVKHESDIVENLKPRTLFIIAPYARGFDFETEDFVNYLLLNPDATDFVVNLRKLLQPKSTSVKTVTVAVHIRKPLSKTDPPLYSIQKYDSSSYEIIDKMVYLDAPQKNFSGIHSDIQEGPLKFPPNQFYIDTIKKLSEFLGNPPMCVCLFTTADDLYKLSDVIKKNVNKKNITYQTNKINWKKKTIDDFYAIGQFDCLIKSTSSFSSISQLLGDHAVTIFPGNYFFDKKKLIINKNIWFIRQKRLEEIRKINTTMDIKNQIDPLNHSS